MDAPVHRLLALVNEPAIDETPERARDSGLIPEVHGQVRLVPRPQDTQALELRRHRADEALRIGAARAAEVGGRHVPLPGAKLAIDLELDRQAVAVEADHV